MACKYIIIVFLNDFNMKRLLFLCSIALFTCCGDSEPEEEMMEDMPVLNIGDSQAVESDGAVMRFRVTIDQAITTAVEFNYEVLGLTAEPNVDFSSSNTSAMIQANETSTEVLVSIMDDQQKEVEEELQIRIVSISGAELGISEAIGLIVDNDQSVYSEEGYITADEHYGYTMAWQDEFSTDMIDEGSYNFEIGDGCPNLCGWGNNELQTYTDNSSNVFVEDGSLVIKAVATSQSSYTSSRITTKDKKEFKYGRIDIRAKITKGQGIWPAIWMLGHNIDDVGWPACGEIDIMENVGHETQAVHGTAHWGPQGRGFSTFQGTAYTIAEDYADRFHVFSLVWEVNKLDWYVDENKFFSITPAQMQGEQYRFNQEFFLIFNVAVGGNWPGNPDETTEFPQQMEIDYIRVFQ